MVFLFLIKKRGGYYENIKSHTPARYSVNDVQ